MPLERAEEALAAGWAAAPELFRTAVPDDAWGLGTPGAASVGRPICGHYTEVRVVHFQLVGAARQAACSAETARHHSDEDTPPDTLVTQQQRF